MTKIAIIATAAVIALASPAAASYTNALQPNALTNNALTANAVIAHAPPSDFFAQSIAQPVGLSFGGLDGMKVMSIELPR